VLVPIDDVFVRSNKVCEIEILTERVSALGSLYSVRISSEELYRKKDSEKQVSRDRNVSGSPGMDLEPAILRQRD
jgi:hypothetical protein